MSRGPGKWQRVILARLAREEGFFLMDCLPEALGRAPTHAERSALYRAVTLLAKTGGCTAGYAWREWHRRAKPWRHCRIPCVWVGRPGTPIPAMVWSGLEAQMSGPDPLRGPQTYRL